MNVQSYCIQLGTFAILLKYVESILVYSHAHVCISVSRCFQMLRWLPVAKVIVHIKEKLIPKSYLCSTGLNTFVPGFTNEELIFLIPLGDIFIVLVVKCFVFYSRFYTADINYLKRDWKVEVSKMFGCGKFWFDAWMFRF